MPQEQLKALTGLRFFAAFAIAWLHADLYFGWASIGRGLPLMLGVSFFFVLSGFILAHAYGEREFSYVSFMRARTARLWPLHVVCVLAVFYLIRPDSQSFDGSGIFSKWYSLAVNAVLLQSWVPTTSYMFSWNSVSWSISTEMFFYAMFPLLLPLLKRNVLLVLLAGVLPIGVLAFIIPGLGIPANGGEFDVTSEPLLYAFPPARLLEFCMGMVAYSLWKKTRVAMPSSFAACTVIEFGTLAFVILFFFALTWRVASIFAWSPVITSWYGNSGACLAFALLIAVMASGGGLVGWVLRSATMVKLGEISFAIYMSHQIVMKVIAWTYPQYGNPLFVLSAIIGTGAVCHYAVEKPAQRLLLSTRIPRSVAVRAAA